MEIVKKVITTTTKTKTVARITKADLIGAFHLAEQANGAVVRMTAIDSFYTEIDFTSDNSVLEITIEQVAESETKEEEE